jgi:hypothetical protein
MIADAVHTENAQREVASVKLDGQERSVTKGS